MDKTVSIFSSLAYFVDQAVGQPKKLFRLSIPHTYTRLQMDVHLSGLTRCHKLILITLLTGDGYNVVVAACCISASATLAVANTSAAAAAR